MRRTFAVVFTAGWGTMAVTPAAGRADLVPGEFAIAVPVKGLESGGGVLDLLGGDFSVLICVESRDDGGMGWPLRALSSLTGVVLREGRTTQGDQKGGLKQGCLGWFHWFD